MSTAVVKNVAAAVLVFGALILVFVVLSGGSSSDTTRPAAAVLSTGTVPPVTTNPTSDISCPAGTVARAAPGPAPTVVVPGYMWSPAVYPTSGWCEIKG